MTTYSTYYCNLTTDLMAIEPQIERYDRKRLITGWTTVSANLYAAYDTGYAAILVRSGVDLGAAEALVGDVDSDGEWFYSSTLDKITLYSTTDPNTIEVEAGEDWATLKARVAAEQAERIKSYLNRPIYKRSGTGQQSESTRDYDWIIIHSNAALTVAELIRDVNPAKAEAIELRIIDPENGTGYLDRLKAGEYKLWHEETVAKQGGIVRQVSINAATTGAIIDTKGKAGCDWDVIKIKIIAGGTFAQGTASAITYSTWIKDDTGLKMQALVSAETINGGYQNFGHGISGRFSPGVYTANDEWEVEVSGEDEYSPTIKQIQIVRA